MEPSKVTRKKIDSELKVEVKWSHTDAPNPDFRRIMRILLDPNPHSNNKKVVPNENR